MHRLGLWPGVLKNLAASIEGQKNIYDMPNDERNIWAMDLEENLNLEVRKKAEVAYFVGCLSSFMGRLAGIPSSMTRIMDHAGVDFTVLESKEWCCGNPLFLAGVPELTEQIVKHNVSTLQELHIKTLVVTCAGCYRAWKQEYPEVLREDFGFEVLHSSEFLARLIDDDKLKFKGSLKGVITYHDPCEIGRYCNIYEAPRKVLENIPNVRFVELFKTRRECTCCGGGGLLKAISPDLALEIAFQKLDEVIDTGANIVTSGCPACKLNIGDAILERKSALEMVDITEIVARALSASE